ncbi:MAG: hypothetical protein IT310_08735 [Anaerolineales bacterium]|nr:hypothetical protein [Anaerolineales bacterium]
MRHLSILFVICLTACSAWDATRATPTFPVLTQTPLPTATYNWFPASATPSPVAYATHLPTPEMRPGRGSVLLADSFASSSNWNTAASDLASAEILNQQINLAAQSKVFMLSLRRELTVDNFYAEITAYPNLCRGEDTYGVLIRASAVAYYRFSLSCNGMVSAERNSVGKKYILQTPLPSGDVPPGAPGEVRIGVWANGTEMRLFLNERFQFSIIDSNYPSGTLGVFVNSIGSEPIIVSFANLTVQTVSYSE